MTRNDILERGIAALRQAAQNAEKVAEFGDPEVASIVLATFRKEARLFLDSYVEKYAQAIERDIAKMPG
jgi:hypothetical protein